MALDANIILQAGRGVTKLLSPEEIQDQRAERELSNYKLQTIRQTAADDTALREIARSTPQNGLAGAFQGGGFYKQAQEAQKFQTEQQKAQREAQKAELEAASKRFELIGQVLGSVRDQASYDAGRKQLNDLGIPTPNAPPQYDPNVVQQFTQQAMSTKDRVEAERKKYEFDNPSASAVLTANTSRANNQATIANSASNAQLTDARARDFNATKVEENKLKREQKEETTNLTKAGQMASFDTMLGTLDRLSKHPGLARSVGVMGALPTIPGSDSANFQAELNTFQSQAFLPMVAQLKGMGALSDAEGKKLTAAVGALDPKMGEKAFRESVQRITEDMTAARARMANAGKPAAATAPAQRKTIDGKTYENDGKGWYPVE